MGKIILGLLLGFFIGAGCRYFDIPLPGPPKLVGALVIASVTLGYIGTDYLLIHQAQMTGSATRRITTAQYCGGPTGLPPSQEGALSESAHPIRKDSVSGTQR